MGPALCELAILSIPIDYKMWIIEMIYTNVDETS